MKEVNYVIIDTTNTANRMGNSQRLGFAQKIKDLAVDVRKDYYKGHPCYGQGVIITGPTTVKAIFTDHDERHRFTLGFIKEYDKPVKVKDADYKNEDEGPAYKSTVIETQ
jgi:hypothetical protein